MQVRKNETFLIRQANVLSSPFLCISVIKVEDNVYDSNYTINELRQPDGQMDRQMMLTHMDRQEDTAEKTY